MQSICSLLQEASKELAAAAYDEPLRGIGLLGRRLPPTKDWLLMATRTARPVVASALRHATLSPDRNPAPLATPPRLRLTAARTGDHPSIHAFLLSIFHGPTADEFHVQLDEPGYQASNRLVVKEAEQVVAHLRLAPQVLRLSERQLPAVRFMDLGTSPEVRGCGIAKALIAAGERAAREQGALIALTRTRFPALFAHHGWSLCGGSAHSTASPRAVLAELACAAEQQTSDAVWPPRAAEQLSVRPLRRVELPGIVRLYDDASRRHSGWPVRSEAYWDWLLSRGACDRIYIASTTTDAPSVHALRDSIVGYACVRQSRIAELVAAQGREGVAQSLLERICADAREQDGWTIRLDAPASSPLHRTLQAAGGSFAEADAGDEPFMMKVLDPLALLRQLQPVLAARAQTADCGAHWELGIELRSPSRGSGSLRSAPLVERYRLRCQSDKFAIESGATSRHTLVIAESDFAPLLVGCRDLAEAEAAHRAATTTKEARDLAASLFQGDLWWRPVLDDLLA